jgi:hypothetical protein
VPIAIFLILVLLTFIYEPLQTLFNSQLFKKYNLISCLFIVFIIFQFALCPSSLRAMSWKKLDALWMKFPAISAITVGGFGFVATAEEIKNPILQLTLESEYTNLPLIIQTALFGLVLLALALITERVGRTMGPDDDGNIPQGWFYTAFGLAFGGSIAMFGLLLDTIFLTVHSHGV